MSVSQGVSWETEREIGKLARKMASTLRGEAFTLLRQFLTYRATTITLDKIVARVIFAAQ